MEHTDSQVAQILKSIESDQGIVIRALHNKHMEKITSLQLEHKQELERAPDNSVAPPDNSDTEDDEIFHNSIKRQRVEEEIDLND